MNLTTATPAEIDTQLADLYGQLASLDAKIERAIPTGYGRERALAAQEQAIQEAARVSEALAPLTAEYARRGGWTRAFLVLNTGGHVHRSQACSTTFVTTKWGWLTQLSGKDEAEIVEAAGSDACTVCYPSAPVDALRRARSVFHTSEEEAQKARAERDAAKAERLAKKIANGLTADGSELVVETNWLGRPRTERFKTERAATTWAVGILADRHWRNVEDELGGVMQVVQAIAAKHDSYPDHVWAELEKKAAAKVKREAR